MKHGLQNAGHIFVVHSKTARYRQFLQVILQIPLRRFQEGK